jgi:hypothetical protein
MQTADNNGCIQQSAHLLQLMNIIVTHLMPNFSLQVTFCAHDGLMLRVLV